MNYEKKIFFFCFILISLLIFLNSTSAWIGGDGDATCNTIFCNLTGDIGYAYLSLDFSNTSGMSDGVDNTILPGENINVSLLNVTGQIIFSGLPDCNTFDSDSEGIVSCGTDATGASGGYDFANNFTSDFAKHNGLINTNTSWVIAIGSLWNKENMTLAYTALDINADDDWNFANNGSAINISTWAYIDSKAGNAPLASDYNYANNFSSDFTKHNGLINTNTSWVIAIGSLWNKENMTLAYTNLDLSTLDDWNYANYTAITGRWKLVNFTSSVFGANMSLVELNTSGQTLLATSSGNVGIGTTNPTSKLHVAGNINLSLNNLTDIDYLFFKNTQHWLTRGAKEVFGESTGHAYWFEHGTPHPEGTILFILSNQNLTNLVIQSGRNNSASMIGNSLMIMPNTLTEDMGMNLSNSTNCIKVCDFYGKECKLSCDSIGYGPTVYIKGGLHVWRQLLVDEGIESTGPIIFKSNGPATHIELINFGIHPQAFRIEEVTFQSGEDVFSETFEDDDIDPFVKVAQIGSDADNWETVAGGDFCLDSSICARAQGGNSGADRIMEVNISTAHITNMSVGFYYGIEGFGATFSDNCSIHINDTMIWNYTNIAGDVSNPPNHESITISNDFENSSITVQIIHKGVNSNRKCYIDFFHVNGTATDPFIVNVTRVDSSILLGDGSQKIFWNDTTKILEIPGNVTFQNVEESNLTVTTSITLNDVTIFDWLNVTALDTNLIKEINTSWVIDTINLSGVTVNCSNIMFADGSIGSAAICDGTDDGGAGGGSGIGLFVNGTDWISINVSNPPHLNVSGNLSTGGILIGADNVDSYIYFEEDGSITGEYLKWSNAADRFDFSDSLSVNGGLIGTSISSTGTIQAQSDIKTTGAGQDLWLGAISQNAAQLVLYANGNINITGNMTANIINATDYFRQGVRLLDLDDNESTWAYIDSKVGGPLASDYNFANNFSSDFTKHNGLINTNTSWVIAIGSLWNKENMTLAYTALDINTDDDWNYANNGSAINISTWAYIDSKVGGPLASDYNYADNFSSDFTKHNGLIDTNTSWAIDRINLSRVTVNCSNMMFADGSIGSVSICDGSDASGGGGFTYTDHFNQFLNTTEGVSYFSINITEDATIGGRLKLFPTGDPNNPDISFLGDSGTGVLRTEASTLAITLGGTINTIFEPTGLHLALRGNQNDPSLAMDGDLSTGLFFPGTDATANVLAMTAGAVEMVTLNETDGQDEVVINQDSVDVDFRIEGNANEFALFVEGSSSNVGIGTGIPGQELEVVGTINASDFLRADVRLIDLTDLDNTSIIRYFNTSWVIAIGSLWNKENMTLAYTALDINTADDWNFANNGSAINISTWAYIDSKVGNAPLASDYNYANNFTSDFVKHNGLINTNTSWVVAIGSLWNKENMTLAYTTLDLSTLDDWNYGNFTIAIDGHNANFTLLNVSGDVNIGGNLNLTAGNISMGSGLLHHNGSHWVFS